MVLLSVALAIAAAAFGHLEVALFFAVLAAAMTLMGPQPELPPVQARPITRRDARRRNPRQEAPAMQSHIDLHVHLESFYGLPAEHIKTAVDESAVGDGSTTVQIGIDTRADATAGLSETSLALYLSGAAALQVERFIDPLIEALQARRIELLVRAAADPFRAPDPVPHG